MSYIYFNSKDIQNRKYLLTWSCRSTASSLVNSFWETAAGQSKFWSNIDSTDVWRGMAFLGDPLLLNPYRVGGSNFTADELIISVSSGDVSNHRPNDAQVFRCKIQQTNTDAARMIVPLKGANDVVQGYIGCI